MSFQSYATLETLMHQRVADRLHEAEQQRLIDTANASHSHAERRPRAATALASLALSTLRYVSSLV